MEHDTEGDAELVRRTVGGDQRALSSLFDRHVDPTGLLVKAAEAILATRPAS